jgi:hypothetical protein
MPDLCGGTDRVATHAGAVGGGIPYLTATAMDDVSQDVKTAATEAIKKIKAKLPAKDKEPNKKVEDKASPQ